MDNYNDSETRCEFNFAQAASEFGQFWHICTPGSAVEALNVTRADFMFNVSNSAISAAESGIVIVTDSIMESHIHSLAGGTLEQCISYIDSFRSRMGRYFKTVGRDVDLSGFTCKEPILIKDLNMMRAEIAYINRNGYVDNPQYVPFSYPWGAGSFYFNPYAKVLKGISYNDLTVREKRQLCKSRVEDMPNNYRVLDGLILPNSYAKIELGESMFRSAHHYFNMISKNYEAYSESAKRLGEQASVSREEIFSVTRMLSSSRYDVRQPSLLPPSAKLEIARILHSDYHASNNLIRSALKLEDKVVYSLFPKTY